jgi:putative transposase
MKYVASKNQKAFMADLKSVCRASNKAAAESAQDELASNVGTHIGLF